MLQKLFYLALAGAAGTLARYWLSGLVQKNITFNFPLGTAAVNIFGCLMFGLVWAILENRFSLGGQTRIIIFVGFFGAFTTFSSFAFESSQMLDDSQWLWTSVNIITQNILGLIGMVTGLAIGKYI
ncbi:MAG: chromosome condensation protein CrcB [Planctomycetes bacterium GWF2_41_51]|nr:MAG: chromosome condensation protein CrcB [Planctomycetes bacterium GWF2_41_51]HBG28795.1 fluoride efflux transporter CrcB [Phycisphaerales bacterium]